MSQSNVFADRRLAQRSIQLAERIKEKGSCIINQVARNWSEQMGFYRLLQNERVSESCLISHLRSSCQARMAGSKEVLILSDSSDFDYSWARHRLEDSSGLGYIGNHKGLGYYLHASLAVDAQNGALLGKSDAKLWHRPQKNKQVSPSLYQTDLEEKESYRWIDSCLKSKSLAQPTQSLTFIQDREGDIYASFVLVPEPGRELLVRSKHDRSILSPTGAKRKLFEYLQEQPCRGSYPLAVRAEPRQNRSAHTAVMELRYCSIEIQRTTKPSFRYQRSFPLSIPIRAIEVRQRADTVPAGESPILWRLLTTHQITDWRDALRFVYWYTLRWIIEDFFRLLKKKGFQLEKAELESGYALRKLGLITMDSAIQVMQLRQARDGNAEIPLEEVFTEPEIDSLQAITPTLEGNTEKLKNPHPPKSLAWASWTIARLGGWKGYRSQRPPGVITFRRGLERFKDIHRGIQLRL
ncbi:MAG: IS4 family transposase [Cyanobacteria bacterium J06614_10]